MSSKAKMVVDGLFRAYVENTMLLPKKYQKKIEEESQENYL